MSRTKRASALAAPVGKGVLFAVGASVAGVLLLALALKLINPDDSVVAIINQIIKILSVLAGAFGAVGIAGEKGAVKGALTGVSYMAVGMCASMLIAGRLYSPIAVISDVALGGSVGALGGAILANLKPRAKQASKPALKRKLA